LPSEALELGYDVRLTAASVSPAAAGETEPLRDRLIRYLEGIVSDESSAIPLDQLEIVDALAAWFGLSLPHVCSSRSALLSALDRDIAAIDGFLSAQVNAILHAPAFQRLEAVWRGLRYITDVAAEVKGAKIRILATSWTEIVRDLERAPDFDQSNLFQKIYSDEFGTPGGEPFGLLIGDYAVHHQRNSDHPTDDITAVKSLASIAGAAFAPIILELSPSVSQLDSFRELGRPLDFRGIFRQTQYQRWNAMRQNDDMRFVGLVLPRILIRHPYADNPARRDGFRFREEVQQTDGSGYLWGSAAFALAATVLRAFANFGWFADIRGAPRDQLRGGIVFDLPVVSFGTDRPGTATKPSVECLISDSLERDLAELGFIALRKAPFTDYSVFNECPSIHLPERYDRASATANARISSMLPYVLCVSRFAHFIKIMGRERIGSLTTAEEFEAYLQKWLNGYCNSSTRSVSDEQSRYPLREGLVRVKDVPGKPGTYSCSVHLRPQYQFDEVAAAFRLVTELSPAA
jgi:type VI secretion system protein ImpD